MENHQVWGCHKHRVTAWGEPEKIWSDIVQSVEKTLRPGWRKYVGKQRKGKTWGEKRYANYAIKNGKRMSVGKRKHLLYPSTCCSQAACIATTWAFRISPNTEITNDVGMAWHGGNVHPKIALSMNKWSNMGWSGWFKILRDIPIIIL